MKCIPFAILTSLIFLTSCSDSPEKLVEDQVSYMEEMTEIIDDIAEGKLSSAEGAEEIKKWGKKGAKIQERIKELRKAENSTEEFSKAGEKYKDRSMKAMKAYFAAVDKLQKSGRMTKELQEAMFNVKE